MDKEGFRNRMKQYKEARGLNPLLKYWEWRNSLPDNLKYTNDAEYDMQGAYEAGMLPEWNEQDQSYHLGSRDPRTGRILKKFGHPTYYKALEEDAKMGYKTYVIGNNTYTWHDKDGVFVPWLNQLTEEDIPKYGSGTSNVKNNLTWWEKLKAVSSTGTMNLGWLFSGFGSRHKPIFSQTNVAQDSYLVDRELQQKMFENKGYTKANNDDYGLVRKAVNNRNIPVFQKTKDAKKREDLTVLGNIHDAWYGTQETKLDNAAHHPTALYADSDGWLYQKGWDLNDYGEASSGNSVYKYGWKQIFANAIDKIGSPTVVTTGFQPVVRSVLLPEEHLNAFNIKKHKTYADEDDVDLPYGLLEYLDGMLSKKGLRRIDLGDSYTYGLPEVEVKPKKYKDGGEVTGPPTYEDWLKSLIKNDLWMHPDYYMSHSLNTATKALKLESAKLPGREDMPPVPVPAEIKGEFPQEWVMNNLYNVENPRKKGVTKGYAKMYDSRTLGAGVDVVSGHPELYDKAKRFGIEKELADEIAYEHIVHDDQVIRDNYADVYGKAAADTLSFGPRFLVAQARYQLGNIRKGWDEIQKALAKGDAKALKKAVLKVTPEDHDYRKKWVKNFNVYGNEPE